MRSFVLFCLLAACFADRPINVTGTRPNIVVLFVDDLGYGDLAAYGNEHHNTLWTNVLAKEGMRFTNWYSASALCTPSRAALLTGRFPIRSGMTDDSIQVMSTLMMNSGMNPLSETSIAKALKSGGYHTGMAGKWHLGVNHVNRADNSFMPSKHGFDYAGLISPMGNNPTCANATLDQGFCIFMRLVSGTEVVTQQPWNTNNLSQRMAGEFSRFLQTHQASRPTDPFFWYHSFIGVHTPLFASANFRHHSQGGLYGDMVEEMDWEVGQILQTIKNTPSIASNTWIFFVSDNGPYLEDFIAPVVGAQGYSPDPASPAYFGKTSAGPFRGGKGQTYEGGFRVPAIVWGPKVLANTVSDSMVTTMDIFPTVLNLAGLAAPAGVTIDGKDITNLLVGNKGGLNANPWQNSVFPYYCGTRLMAARWKKFKMHYVTQKMVTAQGAPTPALPTVCNGECCPYDPASAPVGVCGCVDVKLAIDANLNVLRFPASRTNALTSPIIFDLSKDPHEDHPLTADNFDDYEAVRATIQALVDAHLQTVPVPLPPAQTIDPVNNATVGPPCCLTPAINPATGRPVINPATGQPVITCQTQPPNQTPTLFNLFCQKE
jgi:arylsulfatase